MTEVGPRPNQLIFLGTDHTPEGAARSSLEVILDPKQLQKEREALDERVEKLSSLRPPNIKAPDKKSFRDHVDLVDRASFIAMAERSLQKAIIDNSQGKTMNADILFKIVRIASVFLLDATNQKHARFMESHDFLRSYIELANLMNFQDSLTGQEANIKFAGISLKDVIEDKRNLTPASILKFALEASLSFRQKQHEKIFSENHDSTSLTSAYPTLEKSAILDTGAAIRTLFGTSLVELERNIRDFLPTAIGMEGEIIKKAKELTIKISSARRKILAVLYNPQSPSFPELKDVVTSSLQEKDDYLTFTLLVSLGMNSRENLVNGYRRIKQLVQENDENSPFYELLMENLEKFIDEIPSVCNILAPDDLPISVLKDKIPTQENPPPSFDELRTIIKDIHREKAGNSYLLDQIHIKNVDWKTLPIPVSLEIVLPSRNIPTVGLVFNFKEGDLDIEFLFVVDCNKKTLRWSFLDSPDDPEMETIKDTFLVLTHSMLLSLQQYLNAKSLENSKEMPISTAESVLEAVQEDRDSQKPATPLRLAPKQEKRRNNNWSSSSAKVAESDTLNPSPKEKRKQVIVLPSQDLISSLSYDVQPNIQRRIHGFNTEGIGRIKALRFEVAKDGRRLYELRAGDHRILIAIKPPNGNTDSNVQQFEVVEIGPRKEVFRKKR